MLLRSRPDTVHKSCCVRPKSLSGSSSSGPHRAYHPCQLQVQGALLPRLRGKKNRFGFLLYTYQGDFVNPQIIILWNTKDNYYLFSTDYPAQSALSGMSSRSEDYKEPLHPSHNRSAITLLAPVPPNTAESLR